MSKTDATHPRWVRWNDPTVGCVPHHAHGPHECDLDVVHDDPDQARDRVCHRAYPWPYDHLGDGPTPDDVHHAWWGPQRARTRDACRLLAKQHRASGTVDDDDEPAPEQHRGGVRGTWW